MRFQISRLLALTLFFGLPGVRAADFINWGTPTNISGDSDVVTTGTLVYAYNVGPGTVSATTVNGVTFAAWGFPVDGTTNTTTTGSVTFTENPSTLISTGALGTATGPFSGLSSSYQDLVKSGGGANVGATMTLTLDGLTVGQDYIFQWWLNNSSLATVPGSGDPWKLTTATVGADSVNLIGNVGDVSGNLGQYVTATFTAAATTKLIDFDGTGNNSPLVNAFQLRVVPEPSTWILGTIATGVMLRAVSRRRKPLA